MGEALTTLVKGPSAAPSQKAVRTDNVSGVPEARIEATRIDLRSEWIHRKIHLCVRGDKSRYSQVMDGSLTRPGETSQRHRGSVRDHRTNSNNQRQAPAFENPRSKRMEEVGSNLALCRRGRPQLR